MRALHLVSQVLASALLLVVATSRPATSEPLTLSDAQLDGITAGLAVATVLLAEAGGEHTRVEVRFNGQVKDKARVDLAWGRGVMTAAAYGADGAYAITDASLAVYDYDILIVHSREKYRENRQGTAAKKRHVVRFRAVNLDAVDFKEPIVVDISSYRGARGVMRRMTQRFKQANGNIASAFAAVQASGDNTVTAVQTSTLAIEDAFSGARVSALYAVD